MDPEPAKTRPLTPDLCPPPCVLTDDQQFSGAAGVLFAWIDRGEVNRRTSNQFYSMIQSANSHVRRLMVEKVQEEEEMERAKEAYKSALLAVLTQCKNTSLLLTVSQQAAGETSGEFWSGSGAQSRSGRSQGASPDPGPSGSHSRPGRCRLR